MKMPTGMRALRAQALKAAMLNFMDFADHAIPEDDACMCGDKQDNHTYDSGHSFTAATQYHAMQLRKEVEKYLDVLETDEATTVTHSDLHGNESQIAVISPSKPDADYTSQPFGGCPGQHDLWKDGDLFIPEALKDRNGDVVLGQCKVCGAAEQELLDHPICPGPGNKVYRHG